jgi:hypothetical protein
MRVRRHGTINREGAEMGGILWGIVVVIVVFWLLGFFFHIAGSLIHLLLVAAVIIAIYNLVTSQRTRA